MLTALSTAFLCSASLSLAQPSEEGTHPQKASTTCPKVTIRATMISLPTAEATQFSATQDLTGKPAEALAILEALVAQRKAIALADPTVTTESGQAQRLESGNLKLEVEPLSSPDRAIADINLKIQNSDQEIPLSVNVPNGGAKFLGSAQSPNDKTRTDHMFLRVHITF